MQPWPTLDPGAMIHWVTILRETTITDISGTATVWVPFIKTWAQIDPVSGSDVLKSGQDTTQVRLTVKIRWQAGILANMRIQTLDDIYIIQAPENPGQRNVLLVLNCIALGLTQ